LKFPFTNILEFKKQFGLNKNPKFITFGKFKEKNKTLQLEVIGKEAINDLKKIDFGLIFMDIGKKVVFNKQIQFVK
jgi:hypothetical protein